MKAKEFEEDFLSDSLMVEVKTSGSTGIPKKMFVEKKRMLASAKMTCDFLGLKKGDTALLCMNLDYIGAKMVVVRSIERGMNLIEIEPSGHPFSHVNGNIDFAAIVPLQLYNTIQVPEETEKLKNVRQVIIGGGAISDEMEKILRDFPNSIWSTYGMTETLSHIALRRLSGPTASLWYTPLDGVSIDKEPNGCLTIIAPTVNPTRLVTNDIVEINEYGEFRIIGRKDNVICSGGIKLQIEEIERKLQASLKDPFIITKRKDEKFGEIVVLLTENENLSDVKMICGLVLEKYSRPKIYIHVNSIPMTETGKPARSKAEEIAKR